MPTYQYACRDCGNHFEQVQAFSDPSLTTCPSCSGNLRKVYGSVGVVFKGSGFYRTDSRSGSSSLPADTKSDSSSTAHATPAASTPPSPAAKVAASSGSSTSAKAAS